MKLTLVGHCSETERYCSCKVRVSYSFVTFKGGQNYRTSRNVLIFVLLLAYALEILCHF
jgi:hypothetical protein